MVQAHIVKRMSSAQAGAESIHAHTYTIFQIVFLFNQTAGRENTQRLGHVPSYTHNTCKMKSLERLSQTFCILYTKYCSRTAWVTLLACHVHAGY